MYVFWFFILFSVSSLTSCTHQKNKPFVKTNQSVPARQQPLTRTKRQLLDFKSVPTPWLQKYPIIQQEVKKIIKKKRERVTKDAKKLFQEFPTTALLPFELYVKELKIFKHDNQNIVSVRMAIRIYTGGAHGNTYYYSWNWDKQKNKFISLDEVINSEQFTNLVKQVRSTLIDQRKQNYEYDKQMQTQVEEGTSDKKDFKIWNLKKDGIEIIFPEYQVASFAEGSFEVFVPLKSL